MATIHQPATLNGAAGRSVPSRFIDQAALSEMLSIPERTLERWRLEGRGPKFRKLGGKTVRYDLSDVNAWIESAPAGGGAR